MIRFTWLQFRTQTAVAIGALTVVAVFSAITGPHLVHLYNTNVATCGAHGDCFTATTLFLRNDTSLRTWLGVLAIVVPGIIGIFWGAPLVAHEIEAGTYRLAWTQSVTRTRWLAAKLGVIGLASMATAGLLSLIVTWWASPFDRAHMNRFGTFDQRDVVAIGYAAFAFALGVTAGALIRRTVPAMATTLGVFVFARLAMIHWIRPHLIAPAHASFSLNPATTGFGSSSSILFGGGPDSLQPAAADIPNAWITSTRIVDNAGHGLTTQVLKNACPLLGHGGGGAPSGSGHSATQVPAAAQTALQDCVAKIGATYHEVATYQPASRYWTFQWYELAIFLGAALVLAGASIWWVRRRLS
jgi:hypothetical protein